MNLVHVEELGSGELHVEFITTRRRWLFWTVQEIHVVRGRCTAWQYYPSGERCSTALESYLDVVWTRHQRAKRR